MPKNNDTVQQLLGVKAIRETTLQTQSGQLFCYIWCQGADNSLLGEDDHASVTEAMTLALSEQTDIYQIISIPRTVDTQGMLERLRTMRQQTDNDTRLKLLSGEIAALEELEQDGAKEPLIFLKLWSTSTRNAEKNLMERASALVSHLQSCNIAASIMKTDEITRLCATYAEMGVWQQEATVPNDIPTLSGKKRLFTRRVSPEQQAYAELMEMITPTTVRFTASSGQIGSCICKLYGAMRFPAELDYSWAVKLMGATDCITCITYYPGQAQEIGNALSQSIRSSSRDAIEESDARRRKQFERKAADADRLIDNLDVRGMSLGHISIVVMPWAQDAQGLDEVCRNVLSRFAVKRIKLKLLSCTQKEAWMHLSPYYPNQPVIDDLTRRIIPLETLMGGYPFTANILRDDGGVYFARTPDRGIVSLDIFTRSADRTNGNGIVTGIPGVGKSTLLKSLLESMYMLGVRCIVNDPEREFRDLCRAVNGSWWDAGGNGARVNLLQLQAPLRDDTEEEEYKQKRSDTLSILSLQIQHVVSVLKYLLPSLTDIQMALLKRALLKLYEMWGITMNSSTDCLYRPNDQYPIMEDLWLLLQEMVSEDARYADLALLLEDMAVGADSLIWNGHTNIDLSAPMVVIDTKQLYAGSDRNRAAQYYNLMRMEFTAVSQDHNTPYLVIADEAQTLFDPELPQAAKALKNMALRLRKYEGCLWLAFHSLHELLDDRVRFDGQPILDAAAYKILFGTDGRNLADTVTLFRLTPAEEKSLEARKRGKALALIGNRHMQVEFELPQYKLDLMGGGGGR